MAHQLDDEIERYSVKKPEFSFKSIDEVVNTLSDQLSDLQTTVTDIEYLIDERKSLGHEVCKEIRDELSRARTFLKEFEGPGAIRIGQERIRSIFEQELFALKSERRKELVSEWEDIARLTQQYVAVRYGTSLPGEEEIESLRQSWRRVRKYNLKKKHGE